MTVVEVLQITAKWAVSERLTVRNMPIFCYEWNQKYFFLPTFTGKTLKLPWSGDLVIVFGQIPISVSIFSKDVTHGCSVK